MPHAAVTLINVGNIRNFARGNLRTATSADFVLVGNFFVNVISLAADFTVAGTAQLPSGNTVNTPTAVVVGNIDNDGLSDVVAAGAYIPCGSTACRAS